MSGHQYANTHQLHILWYQMEINNAKFSLAICNFAKRIHELHFVLHEIFPDANAYFVLYMVYTYLLEHIVDNNLGSRGIQIKPMWHNMRIYPHKDNL